jgi:DNA-binding response OmpR family regulator
VQDSGAAGGERAPRAPHVLVVEDDEALATLICTLLTRAGYEAEAAATGQAGLARLQADDVDLVLLDLMLPDVSGLDICRQLRAAVREVYLPVLILTALASDAQRVEGFAAGADDYITKPFNPQELLSRVRVWAQTRQRLVADHQQLAAQARALHEAERRELAAQVEAVRMAARELTDLVNNKLAVARGTLELVEGEPAVPPPLARMAAQAQQRLQEAAECIQQLERVVRLKIKTTPTGPALDLAGSTRARRLSGARGRGR